MAKTEMVVPTTENYKGEVKQVIYLPDDDVESDNRGDSALLNAVILWVRGELPPGVVFAANAVAEVKKLAKLE